MTSCSSRRLHWSNDLSVYLPCLWILFPSKVGLVLVIRIYVYVFVNSFRNSSAVDPDVECVFLLYTVPMWPMACFCFGTFGNIVKKVLVFQVVDKIEFGFEVTKDAQSGVLLGLWLTWSGRVEINVVRVSLCAFYVWA